MRVFEASVSDGVVNANGGIVPNCPILGEGGNSSGYLVIAQDVLVYLPKTTPDVKSFLIQVENLCTKLEDFCTKITQLTVTCAIPGSPSSVPINSVDFLTSKTDITTVHTALTNLKGVLK